MITYTVYDGDPASCCGSVLEPYIDVALDDDLEWGEALEEVKDKLEIIAVGLSPDDYQVGDQLYAIVMYDGTIQEIVTHELTEEDLS